MRRHVCIIAFLLLHGVLLAQTNSSQLSDTALAIPNYLLKNTSHQHYLDVLEFSKKGDSINASVSFAKIDPLYLLDLGHDHTTAESIDTFFSDLLLIEDCKNSCRKTYADAFYAQKSSTYADFKKMSTEDQNARTSL